MKKIAILFLSITILFSSCKDSFIDLNPELTPDLREVYTSASKTELALYGLYGSVKDDYFLGGKTYMVFDNRGEDIVNNTSNSVVLMDTYKMTINNVSPENDQVWKYIYLAVNQINIFLESMEEYNSVDVLGEEKYNLFKAEALFLRSLSFYYLSQLYSLPYVIDPQAKAIPLRLTAILEDGHSDLPASTIKEVYERILADVSDSNISVFPTANNTYNAVTRVSQAAARMLRMRVYMAMEDWDAAIREGEAINEYTLAKDVKSTFVSPYYNEESIFSMPMAATNRGGTQTHPAGYYYSGDICLADTQNGIMSKDGYNSTNDARIVAFKGKENKGYHYLNKYSDATTLLEWIHIFRYAETLLNLAECYAQTGQTNKAQNCLETVRRRSIAASDDKLNISSLTGEALLTAIENEKRLELIGEGLRGIELIRKGQTIEKKSVNITARPTDGNYIWPYPETETAINPSVK